MKRGGSLALAFIAITLVMMTAVSAESYFSNFSQISLADLAQNEWANAALLFFLIFSVCIFALRDVFKRSYGAAVMVALVIGAIGGLGFTYFYGPIIPKVAPWLLVVFVAVILLGIWRFFKGLNAVKWIALILALVWLLYAGPNGCPPKGTLPAQACQVLNFIAIAILLIVIIGWLLALARRKTQEMADSGGGGGGERYMLTIAVQGNGMTNPRPNNYPYRQNVRTRRVLVTQGTLDHWELDGSNMGRAPWISVYMNSDHTLTAVFSGGPPPPPPGKALLIVDPSDPRGAGRTIPREGGRYYYRKGARITIRADPAANFDHWLIDNRSVLRGATQVLILNQDTTRVKAFFKGQGKITLTMLPSTPAGAGKTIPRTGGPYAYNPGAKATIRADATPNFKFSQWMINGVPEKRNPYALIMDTSKQVLAMFKNKRTRVPNLSVNLTINGSSSPYIKAGTPVKVVARWSGGTPPYDISWYDQGGKRGPISYVSHSVMKPPAAKSLTIIGKAGKKIPIGVLIYDSSTPRRLDRYAEIFVTIT